MIVTEFHKFPYIIVVMQDTNGIYFVIGISGTLTGGDGGGSFDGASSMESYSQDPTGYSGSF